MAPGKTATFKQRTRKTRESIITPYIHTTDGLKLEGIDSTSVFGDLASIRGDIITGVGNQGKVYFDGGAFVEILVFQL